MLILRLKVSAILINVTNFKQQFFTVYNFFMDKNINMLMHYHETTKHSPIRSARSLGYMDYNTQPNPYRNYYNSEKIDLKLSTHNATPPYAHIFNELPEAPLCLEAISQLFQFSLGLAATKSANGTEWSLRCNASSGNLHPTEGYIVLPPMQGISKQSTISHYNPQQHRLEKLATFHSDVLKKDEFLISLSSIYWREAWKYGERAFRYVNLDAGHALRALEVSAKLLGWEFKRINISNEKLNRLLGLNQKDRFHENEREEADILLLFSKQNHVDIEQLLNDTYKPYMGQANLLSSAHHSWDIIDDVANSTVEKNKELLHVNSHEYVRLPSYDSKEVILKRRSAQAMNRDKSHITNEQFVTILKSVNHEICGHESFVSFIIFVHDVESLENGLYLLSRNERHLKKLKTLLKNSFLFEKADEEIELYLLEKGDFKAIAKNISCNQNIASDGAFSLSMLAEFSKTINEYGSYMYRELHYECGSIGQQMYLEATSLNLNATGIGCFLDDTLHSLIGLENNVYQSLYHFTVGRAIIDTRITTNDPYLNLHV